MLLFSRGAILAIGEISMTTRIVAVIFILVCSTIAWAVLGSTLLVRTYSANNALSGQVQSIWGAPQVQSPPAAFYVQTTEKDVESTQQRVTTSHKEEVRTDVPLPLESSTINVDLGVTIARRACSGTARTDPDSQEPTSSEIRPPRRRTSHFNSPSPRSRPCTTTS